MRARYKKPIQRLRLRGVLGDCLHTRKNDGPRAAPTETNNGTSTEDLSWLVLDGVIRTLGNGLKQLGGDTSTHIHIHYICMHVCTERGFKVSSGRFSLLNTYQSLVIARLFIIFEQGAVLGGRTAPLLPRMVLF